MSDVVIRAEGLGKRYRLGERSQGMFRYKSLRDSLSSLLHRSTAPPLPNSNDSFWALKDVSFEIKRGEVVGIIGRNGAGKSTLLKILSRITEPTEGQAEIHGRVGSLLEVGTGFHPELTGRENIFLNGAILGMRKAEIASKFDEIVAFAEVDKFIDTPVKHYSSGMYVRLAFAVAAHMETEVLLVDEVLAVGDAAFQKKCLGKMGDIARHGRTVVFVSHNMGTILQLCTRALLFVCGKVVVDEAPQPVVSNYLARCADYFRDTVEVNVHHSSPVCFQSIRLFSSVDAGPTDFFFTGKPFSVEVELECKETSPDLKIAIHLYDNMDRLLFAFNPQERGFKPAFQIGRNSVRLEIVSLPLLEGTYKLNLVAYWKGLGIIEEASAAASFTVVAFDVFESGYAFGKEHGVLLIDHEWKHLGVGASHSQNQPL